MRVLGTLPESGRVCGEKESCTTLPQHKEKQNYVIQRRKEIQYYRGRKNNIDRPLYQLKYGSLHVNKHTSYNKATKLYIYFTSPPFSGKHKHYTINMVTDPVPCKTVTFLYNCHWLPFFTETFIHLTLKTPTLKATLIRSSSSTVLFLTLPLTFPLYSWQKSHTRKRFVPIW